MSSEPRTTPQKVLTELGWTDRDPAAVEGNITDAHILVENRIVGYGVADPTLTRIETLVAAYFATADENGEATGRIEGGFDIADVGKDYNTDLLTDASGRPHTSYWERAVALDPTGRLPDPETTTFEVV